MTIENLQHKIRGRQVWVFFDAVQILLLLLCCQEMSLGQSNIELSTKMSEVKQKHIDLEYRLNYLSYQKEQQVGVIDPNPLRK